MRSIISFLAISLDGFHADVDGGLAWQTLDDDFRQFSLDQLDEIGTLLLGRVTYESMAAYWPTAIGSGFDARIAERMNSVEKVVASRHPLAVEWANSRRIDLDAELADLKAGAGAGIAIFGSATLTTSLLDRRLLDELRIMVNPVLLGSGQRAFDAVRRTGLHLVGSRPFPAGNILLTYRPVSPT
ncbi:dihydrofolate reductase family protein [Micromonospora sp. CPCC 205371]|nr:dihydrofolate reductase family protein [Micromonospora sp. CPCC 205371]